MNNLRKSLDSIKENYPIQRIFYPIGQGAFYAEKHENFNIVYDCGSNSYKSSRPVVQQAFSNEDEIDILFISHLDLDHVSLIETLKDTVKKINYVILPLLHEEQKVFLISLYQILLEEEEKEGYTILLNILKDPQIFFGEDTKIIYVDSAKIEPKDSEPKYIEELDFEIPSGQKIITKKIKNWVFIPHNHKHTERDQLLVDKLEKGNFDVDKLKKGEENYILCKIKNKKEKKKLHTIYDTLPGENKNKKIKKNKNINENSMFLYSGPIEQDSKGTVFICKLITHTDGTEILTGTSIEVNDGAGRTIHSVNDKEFYTAEYVMLNNNNKAGCVYTGDGNMKKVNIKQIYSQYWEYVGTIQIPHHGAKNDYKATAIQDDSLSYYCPISAKTNNKHHPHEDVIKSIKEEDSIPIQITEDPSSIFIQLMKLVP